MVGAETVTASYLSMALLTLIGIGMPLGAFVTQYFVMPKTDPSRPRPVLVVCEYLPRFRGSIHVHGVRRSPSS